MENLIDLPTTTQPSLLSLNEYCLLELFNYLKMGDAMRLTASCIYFKNLSNRAFSVYKEISLTAILNEKQIERMCWFVTHYRHHVQTIIIYDSWGPVDWKMVKDCEKLKRLKIFGQNAFQNVSSQFPVDNLEVFTLEDCNSGFACTLSANIVRKTKALNIINCCIENNGLAAVFRNSPEMKSFLLDCRISHFDFRLLEMISNVEKISLNVKLKKGSELDPLLKLNRLTTLAIWCYDKNISSFLRRLAEKGIMKELELQDAAVDENLFQTLKLFDTLVLLVVHKPSTPTYELTSLIVWPPKLKRLRLVYFDLTFDSFLSMLKQLKHLERIDLRVTRIAKGKVDGLSDVTKMSQHILHAIGNSDRRQRLNVVLPWGLEFEEISFKEYLIDSERLRILYRCNVVDPLQIRIYWPGYTDFNLCIFV